MIKVKRALLLEGILSMILAALMFYTAGLSSSLYLLFLPFELIGNVLRWLSLSSSIGNMLAILLVGILSLIPIFYLIRKRSKYGLKQVDILLPVISIYNFYIIYDFVNPGLMLNKLPLALADASMLPILKMAMAIIFYSLTIGYVILRLAGSISSVNAEDKVSYLCTRLQKILIFISAFYTFFLGYFITFQMLVELKKYSGQAEKLSTFQMFSGLSHYGSQDSSTINLMFTLVKYIFIALPILFTILILIAGAMLLKAMATNHLKEEEIVAATQMGIISKSAVYVTVISNIALNIIQFLLSGLLSDTAYNLEISLFPLIIAFSAMILSGYFKESKELYEDNEMII